MDVRVATWTELQEAVFADAYRDDGTRFVVRPEELLTSFVELESAINSGNSIIEPKPERERQPQ